MNNWIAPKKTIRTVAKPTQKEYTKKQVHEVIDTLGWTKEKITLFLDRAGLLYNELKDYNKAASIAYNELKGA